MRIVTFKIPEPLLVKIDEVVRKGLFSSRSEFIRYAIRKALKEIDEKFGDKWLAIERDNALVIEVRDLGWSQ